MGGGVYEIQLFIPESGFSVSGAVWSEGGPILVHIVLPERLSHMVGNRLFLKMLLLPVLCYNTQNDEKWEGRKKQ